MAMEHALRGIMIGAAAGAAGTTALNAVTYLDMVVTARGASSTPEETVKKLSDATGMGIPGSEKERANRIAGLGPLMGMTAGVGVGVLLGLSRSAGLRPGPLVSVLLCSVGAMIGGNAPMTLLGVTDPRKWSAKAWVQDALPHFAYGIVASTTLLRLDLARKAER